jgi:hypothetical protein
MDLANQNARPYPRSILPSNFEQNLNRTAQVHCRWYGVIGAKRLRTGRNLSEKLFSFHQ